MDKYLSYDQQSFFLQREIETAYCGYDKKITHITKVLKKQNKLIRFSFEKDCKERTLQLDDRPPMYNDTHYHCTWVCDAYNLPNTLSAGNQRFFNLLDGELHFGLN